jgi:hypothetical protein
MSQEAVILEEESLNRETKIESTRKLAIFLLVALGFLWRRNRNTKAAMPRKKRKAITIEHRYISFLFSFLPFDDEVGRPLPPLG